MSRIAAELTEHDLALLRRFSVRHAIQLELFVRSVNEETLLPFDREACPLLSEMADALSMGCPFVPEDETDTRADAVHLFGIATMCSLSNISEVRFLRLCGSC
jgi:hypothetical protein